LFLQFPLKQCILFQLISYFLSQLQPDIFHSFSIFLHFKHFFSELLYLFAFIDELLIFLSNFIGHISVFWKLTYFGLLLLLHLSNSWAFLLFIICLIFTCLLFFVASLCTHLFPAWSIVEHIWKTFHLQSWTLEFCLSSVVQSQRTNFQSIDIINHGIGHRRNTILSSFDELVWKIGYCYKVNVLVKWLFSKPINYGF